MRPLPDRRVATFLDSISNEGLGLATITVWEILNGIARLDSSRRRSTLTDQFQNTVDVLFEDRIVEWTKSDAQSCALIMERKQRRGEALDDHLPDAMLAAAAYSRNLSIVTRNTRDFRNTGVDTIDPWIAPLR